MRKRRAAARVSPVSRAISDSVRLDRPAEQARAVVDRTRSAGADGVVTVGGGSTTGLGKVVALECGLRVVAVPTTYAGSEMTPIYGITDGDRKQTGQDERVIPTTVLYD